MRRILLIIVTIAFIAIFVLLGLRAYVSITKEIKDINWSVEEIAK